MRDYRWIDGDGYAYFVDPDMRKGDSPKIAMHRINAYAWGLLDSPWQWHEIDHCRYPVEWLNVEWNLEAVGPIEHGRRTRGRERRRRTQSQSLQRVKPPATNR